MCSQINRVSELMKRHYLIDKINVATIGNVVSQMHIHIVGRRKDDAYWPDVVWGQAFEHRHQAKFVQQLGDRLANSS